MLPGRWRADSSGSRLLAPIELVGKHVERDHKVPRRPVRGSLSPLAFQSDLGAGVDSGRDIHENLSFHAKLAGAVTGKLLSEDIAEAAYDW